MSKIIDKEMIVPSLTGDILCVLMSLSEQQLELLDHLVTVALHEKDKEKTNERYITST